MEELSTIKEYDSTVPIVVTDHRSLDQEAHKILTNLTNQIIFLADLLDYTYIKGNLINPISEYLDKIQSNATVLLCNNASLGRVKNRSVMEKRYFFTLHEFGGSIPPDKREPYYQKRMPDMLSVARLPYADEHYVREVIHPLKLVIKTPGDPPTIVDENLEYRKIVNGFRLTSDQPQTSDNSIFFFGNSVCGCVGVEDKHTIQSALQRMLNGKVKEIGRSYKVHNRCNLASQNLWPALAIMKKSPIRQNDIAVFLFDMNNYVIDRYRNRGRFLAVDTQPFFERPHDLGEVFIDPPYHMNHVGYQKYAEIIFETLYKQNIFSSRAPLVKTTVDTSELGAEAASSIDYPELAGFIANLEKYAAPPGMYVGAAVMNCNPFTLGHRYLIEFAAKQVDRLFVFVVEEDKSFFPFEDRFELVKQGTQDIDNVVVLPSGSFIISQKTFEAYFLKDELQESKVDVSLDIELFGERIAPALNIKIRFAGEEPFDKITEQYNAAMRLLLPKYGIDFYEIPRLRTKHSPISASRVRRLLEEGDFEELREYVPETTLNYLKTQRFNTTELL
jgi:[citrate (pro-3S)-lyase] ligase